MALLTFLWQRPSHCRAAVVVAVLLGAVASCVRDPTHIEVEDADLQLHSILLAGSDSALVLLGLAKPEAEMLESLSGASVELAREGQMITLPEHAPDGPACTPYADPSALGCYSAGVPGGIGVSDRFELEVRTGEHVITGSTVVPPPPEVLAPAAGAQVLLHCGEPPRCEGTGGSPPAELRIEWNPTPAGWVTVQMTSDSVYGPRGAGADCIMYLEAGGTTVPGIEGEVGVLRLTIGDVSCFAGNERVGWDSLAVSLWVTAFDSTYTDYARATAELPPAIGSTDARAGVEGAFGVFVGAATTQRRLTFVRTGS